MQSWIKLGDNRPKATAQKNDTPEQRKTLIILGDSVIKHIRGYDFLHLLENCKVHVKNLAVQGLNICKAFPSLKENPHQTNT